jgi:hypothetical protein
MTEEKRINPIIEENKSGLQQEEANANQSIMMLSDIIRYSKSNNSEVENDYDLDVDAKGTILLLAEFTCRIMENTRYHTQPQQIFKKKIRSLFS